MKRSRSFKGGDKVFAKIKGYPAWPALILAKNGKKYSVQFYGTNETGSIKPEDIFYYLKNKEQYKNGSRKKEFRDAVEQIEKAVTEAGTDGDDSPADDETPSAKRKRTSSEKSSDSVPSKKSSNTRNSESEGESNMSETTADGPTDTPSKIEVEESNNSQVDDDLPFLPDVKICSEANLKNWIIYADNVKENAELYRSKPLETRQYFPNQVFPVLQPSGKFVGLKLHKTWPLELTNEYDAAMYDSEVASRLLTLKESVTSGDVTPASEPDSFVEFDLTDVEIKRDSEMKLINSKYKRVERLRQESTLVELDAKIKNCLGLSKAEPKKALGFLEQILEVNMDEIMLKKHSHVVEMIRRLRKYIGNTEEWNLSQDELGTFLADAQRLRSKADEVYRKFQRVVKLPEGVTNFWDGFNDVVKKFREDCKFLSNREVFILCAEPYSRQAIIDRLEQEEELQEADIHRPTEVETDKGETK